MIFRKRVGLSVLLLCVALSACLSVEQDKVRLEEVTALWRQFPLYPGMVEVDGYKDSGFGKAVIGKSFRSAASYTEVKDFYMERLGLIGWKFINERTLKDWQRETGGRELKFQKGNYEATIEYAGEAAGLGWDFGIGIGFAPPHTKSGSSLLNTDLVHSLLALHETERCSSAARELKLRMRLGVSDFEIHS